MTKKQLKEKYKKLPRREKEIIAESLLKVNIGVAMPGDLKLAASFLKGSEFIAKTGTLDELIQFLHNDDEGEKPANAGRRTEEMTASFKASLIHGLEPYKEDVVSTLKELTKTIHKNVKA